MPGFAEGSPGSKPARMGRMGEAPSRLPFNCQSTASQAESSQSRFEFWDSAKANLQHLLGLDDISSHVAGGSHCLRDIS